MFIISIRKDADAGGFAFPQPQGLSLRLKDMLEPQVDEKYYLNTEKAKTLIRKLVAEHRITEPAAKILTLGSTNGHQSGQVIDTRGISACLTVAGHVEPLKILEPKIKQLGNLLPDKNFTNPQCGRVYDPEGLAPTEQRLEPNSQGISNTLTTVQKDNYVLSPEDGYRLRKLTPRECFRLMGFTDAEFDRIKGVSNTQLYKQAGNSIVVNVLAALFDKLLTAEERS